MFTGLIEKKGVIDKIVLSSAGAEITVRADEKFFSDVRVGDSVSIDGVCLTAEKVEKESAVFTAVKESVERSIIGFYRRGASVNLERALMPDSRMGGHIVNGHVDSIGRVESSSMQGSALKLKVRLDRNAGKYLIENDSIAVNGVSLTIKSVYGFLFEIAVIPQTVNDTNLSFLRGGDMVNVEVNHITKCVYEFNRRSY